MALPPSTSQLGPLTTTFTPNPACITLALHLRLDEKDDAPHTHSGYWGFNCPESTFSAWSSCYPRNQASHIDAEPDPFGQVAVFSPGNACPVGFTRACSVTRSESTRFMSETWIGCCPSDYVCTDFNGICSSRGTILAGVTYNSECVPKATTITTDTRVPLGWAYQVILVQADTDVPGPLETDTEPSQTAEFAESDGSSGPEPIIVAAILVPILVVLVVPTTWLAVYICILKRRGKTWETRHRNTEVEDAAESSSTPSSNDGLPIDTPGYSHAEHKPELEGTEGTMMTGANGVRFSKPELDTPDRGPPVPEKEAPGEAEPLLAPAKTEAVQFGTALHAVPELGGGVLCAELPAEENRPRVDFMASEPWRWNEPLDPSDEEPVPPSQRVSQT